MNRRDNDGDRALNGMAADSRQSYIDELERGREQVVGRIEELMGHVSLETGLRRFARRKRTVGRAENDYHFEPKNK